MCYKYKYFWTNIFDPLYDYFNQKNIYYISKKYKVKFQSDIGLIYGKNHFNYYVKQKKKSSKIMCFDLFLNII
jgi:hypothetical protein